MHTDTLEAGRAATARVEDLLFDRFALVRTHKGEKSFDTFVADVWVGGRRSDRARACGRLLWAAVG